MKNLLDSEYSTVNGIDIETGLGFCNSNMVLYKKMLNKFANNYHAFPREFCEAIESGDSELAFRLAHSLKGVAGSLGAKKVQDKAAILELACMDREDVDRIQSYFRDVETELMPLINELQEIGQ